MKLLMSAEIDCADERGAYIELKTSRQMDNERQHANFEKHKLLKFWLQVPPPYHRPLTTAPLLPPPYYRLVLPPCSTAPPYRPALVPLPPPLSSGCSPSWRASHVSSWASVTTPAWSRSYGHSRR